MTAATPRRRRSGTGQLDHRVAVASFIGTAIEFYDFYVATCRRPW